MSRHLHSLARLSLPGSARHLALVRIAVCLHVMAVLTSPALDLLFQIPAHLMPWAESVLPEALERMLAAQLPLLRTLGLVSALCGALGLFTRVTLPSTFVCFFCTQDIWFRMSLFHDDWLYFNLYLLVLSLSPCADAYALDLRLSGKARERAAQRDPSRYRVAIETMVLWFASIYVAAGLAKMFPLVKLPLWLNGARPQAFAQQFMLDSPFHWLFGAPPFDYVATRWPFALAALGTLVVELGAVTLVLTQRYRPLVLSAIVGLHTGIFLLGIPGFVQAALVSLVLFVPPHWLERRRAPSA